MFDRSFLGVIYLTLIISFLVALVAATPVTAYGQEDYLNGLDPQGAGDIALILLGLGFLYVGLRWFAGPVKDTLSSLGLPRKTYATTLRHSLTLHVLVMLPATLIAVYHSLLLWKGEWKLHELSGLLTLGIMACLSLAGVLLRLHLVKGRFNRKVRKAIRLFHNLRITTLLLIVGLGIHMLIGD